MNYEKKYKDALKRAETVITLTSSDEAVGAATTIFPELKKSEDERIRMWLIETQKNWLHDQERCGYMDNKNLINTIKDSIAWLEKQGEQKPINKVESKFGVGDWIVYNRDDCSKEIMQIYDIRGDRYYFADNVHFSWSIKECDEKSHLWTIQDAKDGDLIYVSTEIKGIQTIFHKFENGIIYFHCNLCGDFVQGGYELYSDVKFVNPLPKIHYQKFFQKMKEAGYEWDAEKKELKKIEQKPTDKAGTKFKIEKGKWYVCIRNLYDDYANKAFCEGDIYLSTRDGSLIPSNSNVPYKVVCHDTYFRDWTIQDAKDGDVLEFVDHEKVVVGIVSFVSERTGKVDVSCLLEDNKFKIGNFYALDTINPHPATKEQRDLLFQMMKEAGYEWDADKKELRKIEQNPAWSEEDEKILNEIILDLKVLQNKDNGELGKAEYQKEIDWLKSLKPNHWKPSEYDISLLEEIARNIRNNIRPFCSEVSALEDLIKNIKTL